MIVFRATDVHVLRYLFPKLIVSDGVDVEHVAEYLYYFLDSRPDDICISVAFNGEELMGFLIGIHEPFNSFIWLEQCWVDKTVDKATDIKIYELIKDWALEEFGIEELRFQTERNPDAFNKAWGFRIKGYVMSNLQENNNE